jgi:hypothetical protein
MEWNNDVKAGLGFEKYLLQKTVTPTDCRVAFRALNHWFKSGHSDNTFRLFLANEEPAHQYQGEFPF